MSAMSMGSPGGADARSANAFRAYFVFIVIKPQQCSAALGN
jgi:hypothetical protein